MSKAEIKDNHIKLFSLIDFISGSFAGMASVLSGQPLDMIKIRMQTNPTEYHSIFKTAKSVFNHDGLNGFYKGTLSPLCGMSFVIAIQFASNETGKNFFKRQNKNSNLQHDKLSFYQIICSGIFSGLCVAFAVCPSDLFRIKMQAQDKNSTVKYQNTIHCAKQIFQINGIRGIYQGLITTMLRECPGLTFYYGIYENLVKLSLKKYKTKENIPFYFIMFFGSLAGIGFWFGGYPFDVIKSRIQADDINNRKYKSILDAFRKIKNECGYAGFYKGLTPCLLRAPLTGALTFLTYETVSNQLTKLNYF